MTRVFTFCDLLWFLLSLCGNLLVAMGRSRHSVLAVLLALSLVMVALSVLLSYRCMRISCLRNPYIIEDLSYQSLHLYDEMSHGDPRFMLRRHMPPLTVHYMWCQDSHFEFKHYLSLLSVAKVLKPDQIVFHYLQMPQMDRKGYFTWFEDIQREVVMLTLKPIHSAKICSHDFSKGVAKSEDFPNNEGVFMMDDVAITNLSREVFYQYTGAEQLASGCKDTAQGVCEGSDRRPAQLFLMPSSEPYHLTGAQGQVVVECPTIGVFNKANHSTCVQLSQRLFPFDIWLQNKTFDRFARWVVFNHKEPVRPLPQANLSSPRVVHVLKFDGEDLLSPLCYASLHSAFIQGDATHVFVHGHLDPKGRNPLWEQLAKMVPLTHIPTPSLNTPRKQLLYGLHVLLQYGGVLLTCDTIVQKPLQPLLLYPSVSTVHKSIYRIIHHHVDFSVLVARPTSQYLQILMPVLKQLTEVGSERDLGAVAYHLYEQYPTSLHMDSHLVAHLACKDARCVPSPGQLDVRQAYTVKLTWTEGLPPLTLQQLSQLSAPVHSLASLVSPVPR